MNQKMIDFVKWKTGLFLLFFIVLGFFTQAADPDSLRTRWINGKKFTLHKVAPKETWSSVSRRYTVTIDDLQKANPGVDGLKIGQIINVPAGLTTDSKEVKAAPEKPPAPVTKVVESTPKKAIVQQQTGPSGKTHTVQKGETLYRISKMYDMSIEEIKSLNGLGSNAISPGQQLRIKAKVGDNQVTRESVATPVTPQTVAVESTPAKATAPVEKQAQVETKKEVVKPEPVESKPEPVKETIKEEPVPVKADSHQTSMVISRNDDRTEVPPVYSNPGTSRTSVIEKDPKSGAEVEKITEIGVAAWLTEADLNQSKFYALHRTAPVGTIIKLTNRMNNNSVFVKVVGPLPDTGDNNSIIIKITQAAAQRIGALDQKFTAELSYGITR
ncbi:MAG: LysM peptidoglycan-binding domain-containing protein [Bacteroidetes bacterium]|nr:LysM peptidoglycan-binding domain-containing protein [Bacteroidota bacterium]